MSDSDDEADGGPQSDDDGDWGSDDEIVSVQSLFSLKSFSSIADMLENDFTEFGFDMRRAASIVDNDDIGLIMLVNL